MKKYTTPVIGSCAIIAALYFNAVNNEEHNAIQLTEPEPVTTLTPNIKPITPKEVYNEVTKSKTTPLLKTTAPEPTEFDRLYADLKDKLDVIIENGTFSQDGMANEDLTNSLVETIQTADPECQLEPLKHYMQQQNIDYELINALALVSEQHNIFDTATLLSIHGLTEEFSIYNSKSGQEAFESIVKNNKYGYLMNEMDSQFGKEFLQEADNILQGSMNQIEIDGHKHPELTKLQVSQINVLKKMYASGLYASHAPELALAEYVDQHGNGTAGALITFATAEKGDMSYTETPPQHCLPTQDAHYD